MWWFLVAACAAPSDYDRAIAPTEREVVASLFAHHAGWDAPPQFRFEQADERLHDVLAKYGPKARTYRDLGICSVRMGAYSDAAGYLANACRLDPRDAQAARALQDARERLAVANAVMRADAALPGVVMVEPLGGRGDWVVLTGSDLADYFETKMGVTVDRDSRRRRIALRLVRFAAGGAKTLWVSHQIRYRDDGEFTEATLFVQDLDKDGKMEFGVWTAFYGADHMPSVLEAYRPGPPVAMMGHIEGDEWFRAEDMDGDGRIEVAGATAIGLNLAHVEMPDWFDVFKPIGGRYRQVDRRFRALYKPLERRILAGLRKEGADSDLEVHLARIDAMFGRRAEAARLLARAERDARREYQEDVREYSDLQGNREEAKRELAKRRAQIAEVRRER